MASSLPFGEWMSVAVVPEIFRISDSLFRRNALKLTIVNPRDSRVHEVELRVRSVKYIANGQFLLEGDIAKLNGDERMPPYDEFELRFFDHDSPPYHTNFLIKRA